MPLAASLFILGMFLLRCLHSPAAAVALIVVLGYVMHHRYVFFPVMLFNIASDSWGGLEQFDW
jgi:CBS domain-containing membrane protein